MESSSERDQRHGLGTSKEGIAFGRSMSTVVTVEYIKFEKCCVCSGYFPCSI